MYRLMNGEWRTIVGILLTNCADEKHPMPIFGFVVSL